MNVASVTSFLRPARSADGTAIADTRLTVDSTAGGVQLADSAWVFGAVQVVVVDVQTNPVMVTFDNSAPTTTNGHLLAVGFTAEWSIEVARAAKMIATAAGNGVVHASPFSW